ncbi:MAG: PspA/IM30 family protein [Synechococcales cyanobacterium K44_A2020_017]|jgi:phage shock protein A|nr:PspA/IM30 family protein [Synechococcales cyanobacterium K32_A2020_035]MBF2093839.1 PspA/IM30 family protein [Synechococcales cyanobacterium K44_A2020_017]
MGFFQRVGRVIRANLNSLVSQAEDPEKILEQAVNDMQNDLIEMRQGVAQAIATQKRTERQHSQAQSTADEWYQRAQLALQKGDENLAREALSRRKTYQETADSLGRQLPQQQAVVDNLRQNMMSLERKISDAKTKKDMYIARARSAKASQQLNDMLGRVGTTGAMQAFERMEERVHELEARSEAVAELGKDDLESRFSALEGSSVDDDLAAMKAELSGRSPQSLPASPAAHTPEIDQELEELRSKVDNS